MDDAGFTLDSGESTPIPGTPNLGSGQATIPTDLGEGSLSIGNRVFLDVDGDGGFVKGTDETIGGVVVTLYRDLDGDGVADGAAIATSTTCDCGLYGFTGLAAGNYVVVIGQENFDSGSLVGLYSIAGAGDANDGLDGDDNGYGSVLGVQSGSILLTDGMTDGRNLTVDFGFTDVPQIDAEPPMAAAYGDEGCIPSPDDGIFCGDDPGGFFLIEVTTFIEDHARVVTSEDLGYMSINRGSVGAAFISTVDMPYLHFMVDGVDQNSWVSVADLVAGRVTAISSPNYNATHNGEPAVYYYDANQQLIGQAPYSYLYIDPSNDAPAGQDTSLTIVEDTAHVFAASDFPFSDPVEGHSFAGVVFTTVPMVGTLMFDPDGAGPVAAMALVDGDYLTADAIAAGKLSYVPAANGNGTGYDSFTFQVQDDGGTDNDGVDIDPTPRTFTIDVTAVNDAPANSASAVDVDEDQSYTFAASDFLGSDPESGALAAVVIATLPSNGTLTLNGLEFIAGSRIALSDIAAGALVFTPAANANGPIGFTFQLEDANGAHNGAPATMTVNVAPVNDAPTLSGWGPPAGGVAWDQSALLFSQLGYSGDITDSPAANFFSISSPTALTQFTAWLTDNRANDDGIFSAFSGTLGWAIFTDNGGKPGTLLFAGQDGSPTVTDTGQQSYAGTDLFTVDADFGQSIVLQPGNYWFALKEGAWGSDSDGSVVGWQATSDPSGHGSYDLVFQLFFNENAFTLSGSAATSFTEASVNAAPQLLDTDVSFADLDGNFDGGKVTVSGLLAEDRISIHSTGTDAGQISVAGDEISYGGTLIGTFAGGEGGTLTVTLNGSATSAAVEALIESLAYANVSDEPTAARTLTLDIVDGAGAHLAAPGQMVVAVTPSADLPTLTGLASSVTFSEDLVNSAKQLIDTDVHFVGQEGGGTLTVSGLLAEDRIGIRNEGTGAGQIGVSGSNITYQGVVIGSFSGGSGGDFNVTFNSNASTAAIDALIENLTYGNTSDTPVASRTLQLDVHDANGVGLPAPAEITVNVTPDNDAPALTGWGPAQAAVVWNQSNFSQINSFDITSGMVANDFVLTAATPLSSFSVWLADGSGVDDGVFANFGGTLGWAIYSDNGGKPGTLLYSGEDSSVLATYTGQASYFGEDIFRVDAQFGASVTLGAGTYWLALQEGAWGSGADFTSLWWQNAFGPAVGSAAVAQTFDGGWQAGGADNAFTVTAANSVTFLESLFDGGAQLLDTDVTLVDAEGDFDGGSVIVSGLLAEDRVSVRNQGTDAGQIGLSGDEISYGGVPIGTLSGGEGGTLTITLNANATTAAVEALIENLTYRDVSDSPTTSRTLMLNVVDGGGLGILNPAELIVGVTAVNDAPQGQDKSIAIVEEQAHVLALADFGYSDGEGDAFAAVSIATLAATGTLTLDGVAVDAGQSVSAADIAAGKLVYTPGADIFGTAAASFTFEVQAAGGPGNGSDLDASANTIRFDIANVDDGPTGGILLGGAPIQQEVLTVASTLADADGIGTLHYQWQRDTGSGFADMGTDSATYTLGAADVGAAIRVVVSYVDGGGKAESFTSNVIGGIQSDVRPTQVVQDLFGSRPWDVITTKYDALGGIASETFVLDNGGVWINTYDTADISPILWISKRYDASNHFMQRVTTYDDGSHVLTIYDHDNSHGWSNLTVTFDADWNQTGLTGLRDDFTTGISQAELDNVLDTIMWFVTPYDPNFMSFEHTDVINGGGGSDVMYGFEGDDALNGMNGDDFIVGGRGADLLTGGSGSDRFQFVFGDGFDTITDFEAGSDVIELHGYGLADFADLLTHMTQDGDDVVITLDGHSGIRLDHFDMAQLHASDFLLS